MNQKGAAMTGMHVSLPHLDEVPLLNIDLLAVPDHVGRFFANHDAHRIRVA